MLIGGLGYTFYAAQMLYLLYLSDNLLYTCALLSGIGAALLYINTSDSSSRRDTAIVWNHRSQG